MSTPPERNTTPQKGQQTPPKRPVPRPTALTNKLKQHRSPIKDITDSITQEIRSKAEPQQRSPLTTSLHTPMRSPKPAYDTSSPERRQHMSSTLSPDLLTSLSRTTPSTTQSTDNKRATDALQAKINDMTSNIKDLNGQIANERKKTISAETRYQQQQIHNQQIVDDLNSQIQNLEQVLEAFQNEVDENNNSQSSGATDSQVAQLQAENQRLTKDYTTMREELNRKTAVLMTKDDEIAQAEQTAMTHYEEDFKIKLENVKKQYALHLEDAKKDISATFNTQRHEAEMKVDEMKKQVLRAQRDVSAANDRADLNADKAKRNDDMQIEINMLRAETNTKQVKLVQSEKENTQLRSDLAKAQEEIKTLSGWKQTGDKDKVIDQLQVELTALKAESARLKENLEEAKARADHTRAENETARIAKDQEIQAVRRESLQKQMESMLQIQKLQKGKLAVDLSNTGSLEELKAQYDNLMNEYNKKDQSAYDERQVLQKAYDDLKEAQKKLTGECEMAQRSVTAREADLKTANAAIEKKNAEIAVLKEQAKKKSTDSDAIRQELNSKINDAKKAQESLQESLDKSTSAAASFKQEIEKVKAQLLEKATENRRLTETMADRSKTQDSIQRQLKEQIEKLKTQLTRKSQEFDRSERQLSQRKTDIESMKRNIHNLETEKVRSAERIKQSQQQIEELQSEQLEFQTKYDNAMISNAATSNDNESKATEIASLRAQIEKLMNASGDDKAKALVESMKTQQGEIDELKKSKTEFDIEHAKLASEKAKTDAHNKELLEENDSLNDAIASAMLKMTDMQNTMQKVAEQAGDIELGRQAQAKAAELERFLAEKKAELAATNRAHQTAVNRVAVDETKLGKMASQFEAVQAALTECQKQIEADEKELASLKGAKGELGDANRAQQSAVNKLSVVESELNKLRTSLNPISE